MKNNWLSRLLTSLMWSLVLYPSFNGITGLVKEKGLDGAVDLADDAPFSLSGWWEGSWQIQKEKYLNDHFGCRAFFVRLKHEFDYRLFDKIHAKDVIIGMDGYLYERSYIDSYYGKDYLGRDSISIIVSKIREAQSIFKKKGVLFITVIAPGKASFYPDYFPDSLKDVSGKPTNYSDFKEEAGLQNLNLIDFSSYFRSIKDSSSYCLYPKNGIHWSYYAMYIAADSIIRRIESYEKLKLPHFRLLGISVESEKKQDYDLARGLNLLFPLSGFEMAYPELAIESTGVSRKLSSIVIADSFYWGIYDIGFSNVFSSSQFWYYNHEVYPELNTLADGIPMVDVIHDRNVVILLATEHNIHHAGWGFVYRALNELKTVSN